MTDSVLPPVSLWLLHPAFNLNLSSNSPSIATIGHNLHTIITLWFPIIVLLLSLINWSSLATRAVTPFLKLSDLDETHFVEILPPRWKHHLLLLLAASAIPPSLAIMVFHLVSTGIWSDDFWPATLRVIIWTYSTIYISQQTIMSPPYRMMSIWLAQLIADLFGLGYQHLVNQVIIWPILLPAISAITLILLSGTYPLCPILPAKNVARPGSSPTSAETCPEDAASFWGWMSFGFFEPLLKLAHQRTLLESDVWQLSPFFQHRNLFKKYLICPRNSNDRKGWILWRLIRWNLGDLLIELATELWSTVVSFVATYALKRILDALAAGGRRDEALAWASLHFLCNLSFAQFDLLGKWHSRRSYERTRGQLFSILHYKALRRQDKSTYAKADNHSKKEQDEAGQANADIGKIANLMGGDAYMVAERFWSFSGVVTSPLRLILSLLFLYHLLGISAILGGSMVGLAYLLNWPLIKFDIMFARSYSTARDKRMTIANETIQSIRFLKYMGWEHKWASEVEDAREIELRLRIKQMILSGLISFIWIWVPTAVLLVSFWSLTSLFGRPLTVSIAFTSISLFAQLQGALRALPGQITSWLKAYISVKRIEDFLAEEDVPDWVCGLKSHQATVPAGHIEFRYEACFAWNASSSSTGFRLGPISLQLPVGRLTLVTGPTGAGKSTFLGAILGEVQCVKGSVEVEKAGGALAYGAQSPWLESMSIRDNILFETAFDETRYDEVLDACALRQDLAIFAHGDMTEIGEKGISLSGGQKARIALARALYSRAKTVLLDDPLSAVDMHTARKLVDEGLRSPLLKDRTVVLVTHHISLCRPAADYLIELRDGKVTYAGSPTGFGTVEPEEPLEPLEKESAKPDGPTKPTQTTTAPAVKVFDDDNDESDCRGRLIEPEKRHEGRVSGSTYRTYFGAAGFRYWALLVVLILYGRFSAVAAQWALKVWGEAYPRSVIGLFTWPDPTRDYPRPDVDVRPWLRLYLFISLNSGFVVLAGLLIGNLAELTASRYLFLAMLKRVVRAPTRWYDITPTGRILNRFVSDIDTVDFALQSTAEGAIRGIIGFIVSLAVVIWVVPSFAPLAILIAWLYIRLGPAYVKVARDLRRLESVSRSPMFQNFSNLLYGIQSIRAFAAEDRYADLFYKSCDTFQTMDHHYWLASFWLMWRYDCLGSVVVFLTTVFALAAGVNEGYAAISVVQAEMFASATRTLVSVFAQVELDFNAIERVTEYLNIPQEAPAIIENARPPAYWPSDSSGLIVEGLVVRYASHLPPALKGVCFEIGPHEKVGVVGRTGSGKSTLAMSLLRILEPEDGQIILDGIDVCLMGLEDLRTRITIVSQDVTLFEGSIRSNLDPLKIHSDEECWEVLRLCHLAGDDEDDETESMKVKSLEMKLSEGGKSFSAGQKQLLALARAMLRRTRVVIMDEATSSIDLVTDDKIQKTIRECMKDSMVITIAHRLLTVIDYDKIIVLEEGQIVEFDSPSQLMKIEDGKFKKLCEMSTDGERLLQRCSGSSSS